MININMINIKETIERVENGLQNIGGRDPDFMLDVMQLIKEAEILDQIAGTMKTTTTCSTSDGDVFEGLDYFGNGPVARFRVKYPMYWYMPGGGRELREIIRKDEPSLILSIENIIKYKARSWVHDLYEHSKALGAVKSAIARME